MSKLKYLFLLLALFVPGLVSTANAQGQPDFTGTVTGAQTVSFGQTAAFAISISPANGFTGNVNVAASVVYTYSGGSSPSVTVSNGLIQNGSGSTNIYVSNLQLGETDVQVSFTSGSLVHATTITINVVGPNGDFTGSITPSGANAPLGGSTSFTITITPIGSFTGNVTLSVVPYAGYPIFAAATFNPPVVNAANPTSTLTVTPLSTLSPGAHLFAVLATSGNITHQTQYVQVTTTSASSQILQRTNLKSQNGPIPETVLYTPQSDGLYRVNVYLETTEGVVDPNSAGPTIGLALSWGDETTTQTLNTICAGNGIQLKNVGSYCSGSAVIFGEASSPISFQTTVTTNPNASVGVGSSQYSVHITLESL